MTGIVIVVCRNSLHLTRECMKTLLALDGSPVILAIDNASSDGTATYLKSVVAQNPGRVQRQSYREVETLSVVWNKALKYAWDQSCTEALVVNNDTELLAPTYECLKLVMANPVHTLAEGAVTLGKSPGMVTSVGVGDREQFVYPTEFNERNHPDFSCFMIARWAWEELGGFDEGYIGGYFEDANLHVRMHRAGIGAISCGLPFLHHSSGTIKSADFPEQRRISQNYAANKQRFLGQFGCVPGTKAYERLFE